MATLKNSLVSIRAKNGAQEPIPHIGGRTPLLNVKVPHWQAVSIEAQGFDVEWHEVDHVPEAELRAAAAYKSADGTEIAIADPGRAALAASLSGVSPERLLNAPAEFVEDVISSHEAAQLKEALRATGFYIPAAEPDSALLLQGQAGGFTTDPSKLDEIEAELDAKAALQDAAALGAQVQPGAGAGSQEPEIPAEDPAPEPDTADEAIQEEDPLDVLQAKAEALKTIKEAQDLIAEYGIDLGEEAPTTLKGLKAAILEVVETTRAHPITDEHA